MLTKKVIVDQFVVEYGADRQSVTYLETVEVYEDGSLLGRLSPVRKSVPVADAQEIYSDVSLGPWDVETAYAEGDVVSHISGFWQASQTSTGEEPVEASLFWVALPMPSETDQIVESIQRASALYVQDIIEDETTTEEDLTTVAEIVPTWTAWKRYLADDIVSRSGKFYQAIVTHTSQPTWFPEVSYSIWKQVHLGDTVPAWSQPLGAHDAYPAGFRVTHNSITWVSNVDGNVWEPGVSGWTDESTITGEPTIEAWVQPGGAGTEYQIDDVVTHNGSTWISIVANNVWEPGVYGWNEVV
jgi:hypothetical protein